MNSPIVICEKSFQLTWAKAIIALSDNNWDAWNIIVQIDKPEYFYGNFHDLLENFSKKNKLISPKHVAHTIFPQTFYSSGISRKNLYSKYWRFYKRPRTKRRHGWGTYFIRMIKYISADGNVDQLGSIIF